MESFKITIADVSFEVQPLFASTKDYCGKYLTDTLSNYYISVSPDDLIAEQKMLDIEALEEGIKLRKFSEPFLERAVIQRKIANILLDHHTLLMHGSTVGLDGSAYLFTAACGTGKSTHTRFWREFFGERAIMVNDDKPFLKIVNDQVIAYGSPWSGKHGLDQNVALPLKGICILHRGENNEIIPIDPNEVVDMIRHQCLMPGDTELSDSAIMLVDQLLANIPLWKMYCTKDPDAARISHEAMSR